MSTPFQNRLVGTIIVAAAAVIFLPELLDGEKQAYQSQFEEIPEAPEALSVVEIPAMNEQALIARAQPQPLEDEVALDDDADAKPTSTVSQQPTESTNKTAVARSFENNPQPVVTKPDNAAASKTTSDSKAVGWVIQLGSFRHQNNVEQLTLKLKNAGYTVFTRPVKTQAGTLTKVFIGPSVERSALESELSKLEKLTGVQGRIAVFDPLG
ncbi:SPOR domain-containing protein [Thalassotalea mangrovi]|uniref:DedD protein n=1 Tax=Thalassotalea mangrovi TaxID=2572245 RepID=A0A4U1B4D5_9GAMM|nr:SPOR domain-containing protein [Thalassotalea mangrovi]TKB45094.1 dedD protein [Thalassotalea mangrovi]